MEPLKFDREEVGKAFLAISAISKGPNNISASLSEKFRNGKHYWTLYERDWGGVGSAEYKLLHILSDLEAYCLAQQVQDAKLHCYLDTFPPKPRVRVKAGRGPF